MELTCRYCLHTLGDRFIRCADCQNVILCVWCFSKGVEGGSHKRGHCYQIEIAPNKAHIPIFLEKESWSGSEDVKLLEALEMYGIGNWTDIAVLVGSKSPDECMAHFMRYFLEGNLGQALISRPRPKCHVVDHTTAAGAPLSPSLYQVTSQPALDLDNQHMLGYMPDRDDFEREYDNDAESVLCKIYPSFEKDDLEDALRVAQVSIYNQRLRERQHRKAIAREHDLISSIMTSMTSNGTKSKTDTRKRKGGKINGLIASRQNGNDKKSTDTLSVDEKLKPFFRYMTSLEGTRFLENVEREQNLLKEVRHLYNLRGRGVQSLKDGTSPKSKGHSCAMNRIRHSPSRSPVAKVKTKRGRKPKRYASYPWTSGSHSKRRKTSSRR